MTILGNIHDADKGRPIRALATRKRRFSADFPGWGKPGDVESLLPIPEGLTGIITHVESHGMNPWTRYSIRFSDGTHTGGMVHGRDFQFTDGDLLQREDGRQ